MFDILDYCHYETIIQAKSIHVVCHWKLTKLDCIIRSLKNNRAFGIKKPVLLLDVESVTEKAPF